MRAIVAGVDGGAGSRDETWKRLALVGREILATFR